MTHYNGGAVVAMKGKKCVAIASDKRFGIESRTIDVNFPKVFEMGPHLYVGFVGLTSDILTVHSRLRFRKNMYELSHNSRMSPQVLTSVCGNILYEHRFGSFLLEPIVAGLAPKTYEPYLAGMDLLGCYTEPEGYVASGSCAVQLFGMSELLWQPDLEANELYEVISQTLINAVDSDAMSGWGAVVYLIEKDKTTIRNLKTRMD